MQTKGVHACLHVSWCVGRDSNPHCLPSEGSASCHLGYRRKKWCSLQVSNLPLRLTKAVSCRMNERSRLEPAASNRTCISPGTNRRLFQLSYAGTRAPGLPGSRFRNWCWRQELNPQPLAYEALALPLCYASNPHSASPETSAHVGSTGRGSALCRGAPSLKTLSFTQGISRAHPFGRERFSRTRSPSGASERRTQIAICDWCCCGPFGPSACCGGGFMARRRLIRFS